MAIPEKLRCVPTFHSTCDYLGLFLIGGPVFTIIFTLICALFMPCYILNIIFQSALLRLDISRDIGMSLLFPIAFFVNAALLKNNPCCPLAVQVWYGRLFAVMFGLLAYYVGGSCTKHVRETRHIAADKQVIYDEDNTTVTTMSASMIGLFKSQTNCTIIRHDDYIIFYNPVMVSVKEYKAFADENIKRAMVVMGNKFHHMAVDLVLEVFPDAIVTGSEKASERHESITERYVKPDQSMAFPGCEWLDLDVPIYYECWLYFEPANLLCVCDYCPLNDAKIELDNIFPYGCCLQCAAVVDFECACGKQRGAKMGAYTQATMGNPAFLRKHIGEFLARAEIRIATGAHLCPDNTIPPETIIGMWSWMMPANWQPCQPLASKIPVQINEQ